MQQNFFLITFRIISNRLLHRRSQRYKQIYNDCIKTPLTPTRRVFWHQTLSTQFQVTLFYICTFPVCYVCIFTSFWVLHAPKAGQNTFSACRDITVLRFNDICYSTVTCKVTLPLANKATQDYRVSIYVDKGSIYTTLI